MSSSLTFHRHYEQQGQVEGVNMNFPNNHPDDNQSLTQWFYEHRSPWMGGQFEHLSRNDCFLRQSRLFNVLAIILIIGIKCLINTWLIMIWMKS